MPTASWDRDFDLNEPTPADAEARARVKLDDLLEGRVRPSLPGRFGGRLIRGVLLIVLSAIVLLGAYAFAHNTRSAGDTIFVGIAVIGLLLLIPATRLLKGSRPTTPLRALSLFYSSVGAGRHEAAKRLVVPNDFDHFPRAFPDVAGSVGRPLNDPLFFKEPADFTDYWNALLRWPTAPYCLARVRDLEVDEKAQGIVFCRYSLELSVNTQLWALLILVPYVGIIIALIVDNQTRTRIFAQVTKVLISVDDEWMLMNGAWREWDDATPDWI